MKMTASETQWLRDMQKLLAACPSKRLGFYTIGDPQVFVYDRTKEGDIHTLMDRHDNLDFPGAVEKAKAGTDFYLSFPENVHSVAG